MIIRILLFYRYANYYKNKCSRGMKGKAREDSFNRLCDITGCRTQTHLADLLGSRQSSISDWLVKLLRLKGINPEWILTGLGPQNLGPADDEPATHVIYLT